MTTKSTALFGSANTLTMTTSGDLVYNPTADVLPVLGELADDETRSVETYEQQSAREVEDLILSGAVTTAELADRSGAAATPDLCSVRLYSGATLDGLAERYNTTPQQIAAWNGVEWTTAAVDQWVLNTGGRMLDSGFSAFTDESVILLPADGSLSCDSSISAPAAAAGGLDLAAVAAAAFFLLR